MSVRNPPGDYDEEGDRVWTPNATGHGGSITTLPGTKPEDRVERLRQVVAEVTNGRIPVPTHRGPGFY